ncbi:MAG TPA: hypothetical protein VFN49_13600 [Candidatus Aquilonibacter sp.]|nr:hypothetical protein [Candidatus Aquilonibacter sp.]
MSEERPPNDPWDDEKEWGVTPSSYSDAEAAADLATYRALKKSVSIRTLLIVAILGAALAPWFFVPALALVAGGGCGILNSLLLMRSNERVVETRSVGGFVFSSFLRIGLFGIVPVAFAVRGPWWSMGCYFAGFFLPLALYMSSVQRAFKRE